MEKEVIVPMVRVFGFPFFSMFETAMKVNGALQVFILLLSAMVLDGGGLNRFMLLCAMPYWCGILIVMVRRDGGATLRDEFFMALGYPLAIGMAGGILTVVTIGIR